MKRCFIFAAGTYYGLRERPQTGDLVLAADAGYLACRQAGIKPVMITGDHVVTASAIARDLGILEEGDRAITGAQLDAMSD